MILLIPDNSVVVGNSIEACLKIFKEHLILVSKTDFSKITSPFSIVK